jgi:uncharacterized protein (DUF305 family)
MHMLGADEVQLLMKLHSKVVQLPVVATLIAATAAGCSHDGGGKPRSTPPGKIPASMMASPPAYNDKDARFADATIWYLRQGRAVARLAATRSGCAGVKSLAAQIDSLSTQDLAELERLNVRWNRKVPIEAPKWTTEELGHVITPELESKLMSLSGAEFDQELTSVLIRSYQGVIQAAQVAQTAGVSGDARLLATRLAASGTATVAASRASLPCS